MVMFSTYGSGCCASIYSSAFTSASSDPRCQCCSLLSQSGLFCKYSLNAFATFSSHFHLLNIYIYICICMYRIFVFVYFSTLSNCIINVNGTFMTFYFACSKTFFLNIFGYACVECICC